MPSGEEDAKGDADADEDEWDKGEFAGDADEDEEESLRSLARGVDVDEPLDRGVELFEPKLPLRKALASSEICCVSSVMNMLNNRNKCFAFEIS